MKLGADLTAELEAAFRSPDWQKRREALATAAALGWNGRDLVLQFLQDESDVISAQAQSWFVAQGEQALDYLVTKLAGVDEDIGVFAGIVGGQERSTGKSLAGTIWLCLVDGLSRNRCHEILKNLVRHPSPMVRAIVLHTVASLRSRAFLEFLEMLSRDNDPLVREKFSTALVRLLILDWYSTPELDESTVTKCLDLLEPELLGILDSDIPANFFSRFSKVETLGDALGRDVLPFHRDRLISLLESAIPRLGEKGASRAGAAIEGQCWINEGPENSVNSAWLSFAGKRRRDMGMLNAVSKRLVERLEREATASTRRALFASLSQFPYEVYGAKLAAVFFGFGNDLGEASPNLAVRFYLQGMKEKNAEWQAKALSVLIAGLNDTDEKSAMAGVKAALYGLKSTPPAQGSRLAELLRERTGRLLNLSRSAPLKDLPSLLEVLLVLGDDHSFEVFERAWSCRHHTAPDQPPYLSSCVSLFSKEKDKRLVPMLIEYIKEDPEVTDPGLKATCVYSLLGANLASLLKETAPDFFSGKGVEKWTRIIQNPEEHPRVRAAFADLLIHPGLSNDQRSLLSDIYLKLTRAPNDWNLRSKACCRLGQAGDRRILPVIDEMMMSDGVPSWVPLNCLSALYALEARGKGGSDKELKPGARQAVQFLETLLFFNPTPSPEVKILQENNFGWAVLYQVYPPLMTLQSLRDFTGQDFGYDVGRWEEWLETKR
jgi:hypothetical protein